MNPLKCIIIDDEPLAIEIIEGYVEKVDSLDLLRTFRNPVEAFDFLKSNQVDLAFLDIQMPDITGLELAKTLNPSLNIIFTTAYREYAVDSYELNALDYLVKPISFQRFLQAIGKLLEKDQSNPDLTTSINITSEGKTYRVKTDDINYVESFKDYVTLHLNDKKLVCYQHISHIEKLLPQKDFIRIHRGFIVAVRKIISYTTTTIDVPGDQLPIGRTFKEKTLQFLKGLK